MIFVTIQVEETLNQITSVVLRLLEQEGVMAVYLGVYVYGFVVWLLLKSLPTYTEATYEVLGYGDEDNFGLYACRSSGDKLSLELKATRQREDEESHVNMPWWITKFGCEEEHK